MGTSQSSDGAPSGVPMVPPWVPDLPPLELPPSEITVMPAQGEGPAAVPLPPVPIAPAGRFAGARRSLGGFVGTGDAAAMRRGLGHYIRSGYGGSATATRRFGGTAATAGALYGALSGGPPSSPGETAGRMLDRALLAGRSARELIDAVIEVVRPVDGTQDAEAERISIRDSLAELLAKFPDADLLNLTDEQKTFAIERYVAMDIFHRLDLDLGKHLREKAPSAVTALARLKEVKNYLKETVAAAFRKVRADGHIMSAARISGIVRAAIQETFHVFEGYAE